jgi:hypothetical protein
MDAFLETQRESDNRRKNPVVKKQIKKNSCMGIFLVALQENHPLETFASPNKKHCDTENKKRSGLSCRRSLARRLQVLAGRNSRQLSM